MFNTTQLRLVMVVMATALATGVATASADEMVKEKQARARSGLHIGIGIGAGHMDCEGKGCESMTEAGGMHVQLGTMLTPRLALTGDVWAMAHRDDRLTLTHMLATVGPQIWLAPRFWIRAGIGGARAGFNYDVEIVDINDQTETVLGLMGAAGIELMSRDNFALDLQLRAGTGFFEDEKTQVRNIALGIGANWY